MFTFRAGMRRPGAGVPLMLVTVVCSGLLLLPALGAAQAAAPPSESDDERERPEAASAERSERNSQRGPVATVRPDVPLRERWAAPFAVYSAGGPIAREPRAAVVLRDSADAGQVARAQVRAGRSAADVDVEEGQEGDGGESAADRDAETASSAADAGRSPPVASAPGSTPPGESAAADPVMASTHRVAFGETWYGLVRRFGISSTRLASANPEVDPERLRAGTVLQIPGEGPGSGGGAASRTHVVVRGDTLYGIAGRYGVSPDAVRAANRLTGDVVRLGQTLVIPREEATR